MAHTPFSTSAAVRGAIRLSTAPIGGTKFSPLSRSVLLDATRVRQPQHFSRLYSNSVSNASDSTAQVSNKRAILFPGQGSQYVGMGRDLYETYPIARQTIDEADAILSSMPPSSPSSLPQEEGYLKRVMFEGPQEELTRTENAQPAILTTSIALLRVLETEHGLDLKESCRFALGHSLGEYSALVATRALRLADAVRLVRIRGDAMTKAVTNRKGMTAMSALVVRASKLDDLVKAMHDIQNELSSTGEIAEIANINSSFQVVISGTVKGVDHASKTLQFRKIAAKAVDLPVSAPFHCSLMEPAARVMKDTLADISFKQPIIPIVSNVQAQPIESSNDIPNLLVQQVTDTVQWRQSLVNLHNQQQYDISDYICIGPGKVICNLLRKEYPLDTIRSVSTVEDIQQWKL
ncbi:MAG: acyl transferase/acyl hydrolase/lysophospholipase [Linnemannia elongata]|nr:MAG: acyl transferase/acyl hydrolase/lysophospholipase [Linnemannia elongata]